MNTKKDNAWHQWRDSVIGTGTVGVDLDTEYELFNSWWEKTRREMKTICDGIESGVKAASSKGVG
jgi:hypothetical protein